MQSKFWGIQTLVFINSKRKKKKLFKIFYICFPEKKVSAYQTASVFMIYTASLRMSGIIRP